MPKFNFSINRIKPKETRDIIREDIKDLEGEIWKPTKYENYYCSNKGRVKSIYGNKIVVLKQHISNAGYYRVPIQKDINTKSTISTHRLIAETFIPNPNNLPEVNHINLDKLDNRVENFEWVTSKENSSKRGNNKKVKSIDIFTGKVLKEFDTITLAAEYYNLDKTSILRCCNHNSTQKCVGDYIFRYVDDFDYDMRAILQIDPATNKIVKEYVSITAASKILQVRSSVIVHVLKGNKATGCGYYWRYKDEN